MMVVDRLAVGVVNGKNAPLMVCIFSEAAVDHPNRT